MPGEIYIKKGWEEKPLVRHIFIPNSLFVGYKHKIESLVPQIVVNDQFEYEDKEISDEEYYELRKNH